MTSTSTGNTAAGDIWHADSVRDAAESLGILNLPQNLLETIAADVDHQVWGFLEEAIKFMRHSKRTKLKVCDVDYALRVRNIEPLWGFSSLSPPTYKRLTTSSGNIYVQEDEEIDLGKILSLKMPSVPRDLSYTAHWLAIEGVQPTIPQNPSPTDYYHLPTPPPSPSSTPTHMNSNANGYLNPSSNSEPSEGLSSSGRRERGEREIVRPPVRHTLSRELQLYFERLTKAALSTDGISVPSSGGGGAGAGMGGDESQQNGSGIGIGIGGGSSARAAAVASLREESGLQQLVPYLARWIGGTVGVCLSGGGDRDRDGEKERDGGVGMLGTLEQMLMMIHAMMGNEGLFIDPYLHQLLPSILSILLSASLPIPPPTPSSSSNQQPSDTQPQPPTHHSLRAHAASLLAYILEKYSDSYPSLKPRLLRTLLRALVAPVISSGTNHQRGKEKNPANPTHTGLNGDERSNGINGHVNGIRGSKPNGLPNGVSHDASSSSPSSPHHLPHPSSSSNPDPSRSSSHLFPLPFPDSRHPTSTGPPGTRLGAVFGLESLGPETVKRWMGGNLRALGEVLEGEEVGWEEWERKVEEEMWGGWGEGVGAMDVDGVDNGEGGSRGRNGRRRWTWEEKEEWEARKELWRSERGRVGEAVLAALLRSLSPLSALFSSQSTQNTSLPPDPSTLFPLYGSYFASRLIVIWEEGGKEIVQELTEMERELNGGGGGGIGMGGGSAWHNDIELQNLIDEVMLSDPSQGLLGDLTTSSITGSGLGLGDLDTDMYVSNLGDSMTGSTGGIDLASLDLDLLEGLEGLLEMGTSGQEGQGQGDGGQDGDGMQMSSLDSMETEREEIPPLSAPAAGEDGEEQVGDREEKSGDNTGAKGDSDGSGGEDEGGNTG